MVTGVSSNLAGASEAFLLTPLGCWVGWDDWGDRGILVKDDVVFVCVDDPGCEACLIDVDGGVDVDGVVVTPRLWSPLYTVTDGSAPAPPWLHLGNSGIDVEDLNESDAGIGGGGGSGGGAADAGNRPATEAGAAKALVRIC